eukprot:2170402-Amphidinium_carterae.1
MSFSLEYRDEHIETYQLQVGVAITHVRISVLPFAIASGFCRSGLDSIIPVTEGHAESLLSKTRATRQHGYRRRSLHVSMQPASAATSIAIVLTLRPL